MGSFLSNGLFPGSINSLHVAFGHVLLSQQWKPKTIFYALTIISCLKKELKCNDSLTKEITLSKLTKYYRIKTSPELALISDDHSSQGRGSRNPGS